MLLLTLILHLYDVNSFKTINIVANNYNYSLMRVACHIITWDVISGISKSMKTLIDIINISTGKWKKKERAREKKGEHKREEEGEISSACTLMHCILLYFSAVCHFLSSFAHAYAPYTRFFWKLLMCSAVHREASIHSIFHTSFSCAYPCLDALASWSPTTKATCFL